MIYIILFFKKIVEKVQQRWKSARDAKMRSIAARKKVRSGSERKNHKTYMYDQQLQFLESLTVPNMYVKYLVIICNTPCLKFPILSYKNILYTYF